MNNPAAKKSLGQNFLKSKKAIMQMLDAVSVSPQDTIVEIGPGKGALTIPLLERGAKVIAFELDERMIEYLNEQYPEYIQSGQLSLVHADVIELDLKKEIPSEYKLVANIPYYITSLIMRKFLSSNHQPKSMSLLMQKEVAERIVVRDEKESLLSLSVSVFADAKYISKVEKKYFSPSPKVDSAILALYNIQRSFLDTQKKEDYFFALLKAAFSQKRKKALKNISQKFPHIDWPVIFAQLGIDEKTRAEKISIELWKNIFELSHQEA